MSVVRKDLGPQKEGDKERAKEGAKEELVPLERLRIQALAEWERKHPNEAKAAQEEYERDFAFMKK